MRIILQQDEAEALERVLDLLLINQNLSQEVFQSPSERRTIRRISMKLHWSKPQNGDAA